MTRYRVGLDLDGTLLDSRARHGLALERVASERAVDLPGDVLRDFVELKRQGRSGVEVLRSRAVPEAEQLVAAWQRIIEEENLLTADGLYPGVGETLQQYFSRGWRFVVVTSRTCATRAIAQWRQLDLAHVVDGFHVVSPGAGPGKADVTRHMQLSGIVGDTELDLAWAEALAVPFVAVDYGFRSAQFWLGRNQPSVSSLDRALGHLAKPED